MTTAQPHEEPTPRYFSDPEEALRNARPLPPRQLREIEGIEPEMWDAFYKAINRA